MCILLHDFSSMRLSDFRHKSTRSCRNHKIFLWKKTTGILLFQECLLREHGTQLPSSPLGGGSEKPPLHSPKIDVPDSDLPMSPTSTDRCRGHRFWGVFMPSFGMPTFSVWKQCVSAVAPKRFGSHVCCGKNRWRSMICGRKSESVDIFLLPLPTHLIKHV